MLLTSIKTGSAPGHKYISFVVTAKPVHLLRMLSSSAMELFRYIEQVSYIEHFEHFEHFVL